VGLEHRKRGPGPEQDADLHPLGKLGQQVAERWDGPVVGERELRTDVPAGDVDMRAGAPELIRYRGEGVLAVDQDVERVSGPRRRIALDPEPGIR
jgi:hypothetical protein